MSFALRVAERHDIAALEALIPLSTRELQAPYYSPTQIDGALGTVFAVDRQLIADGTYFVVEDAGAVVGCGGWSKRKTLFGGDQGRQASEDALLDPAREPARIRAFFVHPQWARRGIGMRILRDHIKRLRGQIQVATKRGQFTRIRIRLPTPAAAADSGKKALA